MEEQRQNILSLIKTYFAFGLSNKDILRFLAQDHGIIISNRTLKRRLSMCRLYRRKGYSDLLDVSLFILQECDTSGKNHGYRWMHRKCQEQGYIVGKDTVRVLLMLIDPEGVRHRSKRRLVRRSYVSTGPNAVWHIDGYDKLKPYGICIHGCIDGFSRKVIWLHAANSNNNPKVIAKYFVEAVKRSNGCPERVRSDAGTENVAVEQMQCFLRREHVDRWSGMNSFMYGSSTTNQRIESWWGILRKKCAQYWMDLFSELKNDGHFTGDFIDKNLIQFCFLDTIEKELQSVAHTWNYHRIRTSKTGGCPGGKPSVLYSLPAMFGYEQCIKPVKQEELQLCELECARINDVCCDPTVYELCSVIMEDLHWQFPKYKADLLDLYIALRRELRNGLQ